jgi:hypothetical protein
MGDKVGARAMGVLAHAAFELHHAEVEIATKRGKRKEAHLEHQVAQ